MQCSVAVCLCLSKWPVSVYTFWAANPVKTADNYTIWQKSGLFYLTQPLHISVHNFPAVKLLHVLAFSCGSRPHATLLTKGDMGGAGGEERRQLLDKIKRPVFVPDNKTVAHLWCSSTAAGR